MTVKTAYWDASAVVALCTPDVGTVSARRLARVYSMVTWWATPVEVQSALARHIREQSVPEETLDIANQHLRILRAGWREIEPSEQVRDIAESLPGPYEVRAGDALQLAAALVWCKRRPKNRPFVCFDRRLVEAASRLGFDVLGA